MGFFGFVVSTARKAICHCRELKVIESVFLGSFRKVS